jgi:hypothetical protein
MSQRHSEAAFETAIETHLLANGYATVNRDGFDRERAIFPETVLAFIRATQPKEWARLEALHGKKTGEQILDGSYCLFRAPVTGTRQGKIVLVQLHDSIDPGNGERYTVKRYLSEKVTDGDSWRHVRVTLKPINPDFEPIELTGAEDSELQVVAEFVEVLGGGSLTLTQRGP